MHEPPSELKIAANRRNALKSTGPKSAAGKRRVSLNTRKRGLIPEVLEQDLLARGEDPRDFRCLHRDLIAIFRPDGRTETETVLTLAETWWEKARRIRLATPGAPERVDDLDKRLDLWLQFMLYIAGQRHEWWHRRLVAVLGRPLGGPMDLRRKIEARLFVFGAKPGQRKYPKVTPKELALEQLLKEVKPILMGAVAAGMSAAGALGSLGDNQLGETGSALPIADLKKAMALDSTMRVLVAHGITDQVTPYFASQLLLDQVPPMGDANRLRLKVYGGGHMLYFDDKSRAALREDARKLVAGK